MTKHPLFPRGGSGDCVCLKTHPVGHWESGVCFWQEVILGVSWGFVTYLFVDFGFEGRDTERLVS